MRGSQGPRAALWKTVARCVLWLVVGLFGTQGCTSEESCKNNIGNLTVNPNDSQCKTRCECNNQYYTGYCVDGKCKSIARGACDVPGKVNVCYNTHEKCDGKETCQPPELKELRWGDCSCNAKGEQVQEPTNKPDASGPERTPEPPTPDKPAPDNATPPDASTPDQTVGPEPQPEPVGPEPDFDPPFDDTISPDGTPPPDLPGMGNLVLGEECQPGVDTCQTGLEFISDGGKGRCLRACNTDADCKAYCQGSSSPCSGFDTQVKCGPQYFTSKNHCYWDDCENQGCLAGFTCNPSSKLCDPGIIP